KMLLFSCILISYSVLAQTKTFSGTVKDESTGQVLAGATVLNKTAGSSVISGENGTFSISGKEGDVLEVSYAGYSAKQITLNGETVLIIQLATSALSGLDEVVVVGYGTQKRSNLTGSVSKLDGKILETGVRSS